MKSEKFPEIFQSLMQKHSVLVQLMHVFVSYQRVSHCRRVASLSLEYALQYCIDPEAAFLAALSHDICREYSNAKLLHCARHAHVHVAPYELENPLLLHGKVAPIVLRSYYPMSEKIYAAIETHTLGCEFPSALQTLVYVCDALDGERALWKSCEGRIARKRILAQRGIHKILCALISYMESVFCIVHPITAAMKHTCPLIP